LRRPQGGPGVAQLAAVPPGHPLGVELRLQPHRRHRPRPGVALQVAVPRRRHQALPDAARRLPGGRRGLGLQPVRRHRRPLGEAQRSDHPRPR
jgi:hypothetical protein